MSPPVQILLKEVQSHPDNSFTVAVHGTLSTESPLHVRVTNPFTTREDATELSWYCEAADKEPFSVSPRLQRVERSLHQYGTRLFTMLFPPNRVVLPSGPFTVRIIGTVPFCSLHWELLRDPARGPVALDVSRCVVRDVPASATLPHPVRSYPTLNVLFLTARQRTNENDIPLRIESLAVMDGVRDRDLQLRFDLVRPGTITALRKKLAQNKPGFYHILHLDCHGVDDNPFDISGACANRLVLETERASYNAVSAEEIADIVDTYQIPIVFTSACRSGMTNSRLPSFAYNLFLRSKVHCVVAMALSVLVDTTARFVREFYSAMLDPTAPMTVSSATRHARRIMAQDPDRVGVLRTIQRQDWWIPQLFERTPPSGSHAGHFVRCTWEQAAQRADSIEEKTAIWKDFEQYTKRKNLIMYEAVDLRTFIGRDRDLRMLECKVFSNDRVDNIILLYGMMGCGKTAFLTYVSWWWCVSGLVKDKFVFRMDEKPFSLNNIIWHIYRQLFDVQNYDPTQQTDRQGAEIRRRVTEHLHSNCYVVVIDGAEKICMQESGAVSEVAFESVSSQCGSECDTDSDDNSKPKQPLNAKARTQEEIAQWLADLQGGSTIVLIGSRGSHAESALMRYIKNKSNKLDLATIVGKYPAKLVPNLSRKWSEVLVKQILEVDDKGSAPKYAALYSYPMLDLYAGNPLVINLVVGSFKAGDMANMPHSENLYENLQSYLANSTSISVMSGLEYSFSLLSPAQQKALLFLAPFKGSVSAEGLQHYADALEEDVYSVLNFDRAAWNSALDMAVRWGLLTVHERVRKQRNEKAWRIHACLSILLIKKFAVMMSATSRGNIESLSNQRMLTFESMGKDSILRPLLKPMHVAYWKRALELYDLLRHSDKDRHDIGVLMTEIDFWNLKRVMKYALEEKQPFYGILLPLYWYLASKNDIAQRYALCRKTVEKIGTFNSLKDIHASNAVYRLDIPRTYHIYGMLLGHNRLNQLNEAGMWFKRTKKIWEECGNKSALAVTEHELGWCAMNKRDYAKARMHYNKAMELSQRLERSRTLHNMGLLAAREEDFELARKYHEDAKELYREEKDARAIASAYHHLAIVEARLHKFDEAEEYARRAQTIRMERCETEQIGHGFQLRGNIALRRAQDAGLSRQEALRALNVAKDNYDNAMLAYNDDSGYNGGVVPEREMLHENYGLLVAVQRSFETDAEKRMALQRTEMESYVKVRNGPYPKALYNLGLNYEQLGHFKEAYECFKRAADITPNAGNDSMDSEACRRALEAQARCLAQGKGVEKDEHEALTILLRQRGEIGNGDPLASIGLAMDSELCCAMLENK